MKKKTLIMLLSTALVIATAVFGTIAYMTDTASLTNRFTLGNVTIALDETQVDASGQPVMGEDGKPVRTPQGNAYHLLPGKTFVKDPTVTVGAGSESSYVRLLVTVSRAAELDALCKALTAADPAAYPQGLPQDNISGYDASAWVYKTQTTDAAANTVTYEFRYYDAANSTDAVKPDGTNDLVLDPLFDSITVPAAITGEQLASIAGFDIQIVAQAIQTEGFADADAAWAAFEQSGT